MASMGLNEESVEKKLMSVMNTQDSIQSLSLWIIHHKTHYAHIVELWYKVMKKSVKPSHRLTLFYLCNDVVQTCKRKKATVFVNAFKPLLKDATALVRDATIRPKVERIFNVWEERLVFEKDFVTELRAVLDGKQADGAVFKKPFSPTPKDRLKEKQKGKGKEKKAETAAKSSVTKDSDAGEDTGSSTASAKEETKKDDDAPSEETLAAFKPADLISKMQSYKKQASEVDNSVQKVSHLKLDASSIEAVKQLKDRAHGNEFSTDFEESCLRLEETAEGLDKLRQERKDLMAQLHIAEHFYNQQHSEARIVANAYKSYGARINMVKKKLSEMVKTLPSPAVSPPPQDASSGSTPPDLPYKPASADGILSGNDDSMNGDGMASPSGSSDDNFSGVSQLENRLTSFIPSLQSMGSSSASEDEHPIPVYIPQPINNGNSSSHRLSANRVLTDSEEPFPSEEGGSTPLTDEPPTTPVMDEEPESSPSPPPPPPPPLEKRKENPIDFLSRLISQTQKSSSQSSSGVNSSFLANFTRLTSQMKEQTMPRNNRAEKEEEVTPEGSPRPKSWAEWKAEKASRVEPPDTSVPPPSIPGFGAPLSTLASLGIPPPPLPVPPVRLVPPLSSLPPLAMPVASVPPPGAPSSLAPLVIPPPLSPMPDRSIPSLTSPSSLAPHGVPPPPTAHPSSPVPTLSSPSALVPHHISPIKSITVPPPATPSPISPRAVSVAAPPHPVPSPGLSMPSSPFYEHTSPGQKENWPEAGEAMEEGEGMMHSPTMEYSGAQVDMPFPPVSMRMRSNNSVLKELTPSTEDMPASEPLPVSSPGSSPVLDSKPAQSSVEEVSAIATLASSPGRGGQGFMDKLKHHKISTRGYLPSTYAPNPNLMTLTPGGEGDMDEEEEDEEEEEEEEANVATRIPVLSSVVRRVDPREKKYSRDKDRHRDRDSKYQHGSGKHVAPYPSASSHRSETFRRERRYSRENCDQYTSASSSYRDRRSYDYDSEQQSPDYLAYSEHVYEDRGYDSYSYGQSSVSRHKYGISQGSSHRSYRH
ncbi:uncharacterized protein LOC143282163 [Babylonia areolata]|uniref:uncharacterized protein LOC143282163 n=1 Tax=Babylonia areolata TaxID=304850 RepID=UPI003FD1A466